MEEFSPEWFDYSSKMWMMNKKRVGQSYVYVCKKEGCKNKPHLRTDWCVWHHPEIKQEETPLRRSARIQLQKRNENKN
jgi:hypothetical protein